MKIDDPAVQNILRRSMVARIATLSHNGRPNINPLYFVSVPGHIWLDTVEWTLAARNVKADPRVSILFEVEQDRGVHQILRMSGHASVRTDPQIQHACIPRMVCKYYLTPGSIRNTLAHFRQLSFMHRYHAQAAEKGRSCVIDVIPEHAEFLNEDQRGGTGTERQKG